MKATAEKSTTSTTSVSLKPATPFFAKAGGCGFFTQASAATPDIQPKMAVNKPGDRFEREADSTAERIIRATGNSVALRGEKINAQPEEKLRRKEKDENGGERSGEQEINDNVRLAIRSRTDGGIPLPRSVRSFMEPRFGNDFSNVRIHNDSASAQLNHQLNARAFTHRNHIFFGSGQFSPETTDGKQLLAHELTHVVQQGSSPSLSTPEQARSTQNSENQITERTGGGSDQPLQRGILNAVAEGAGMAMDAISGVFNEISSAIGMGIAAAQSWIRNIAGGLGLGIAAAWSWIKSLSGRIGTGIRSSISWVTEIASTIGTGLTAAWSWIQLIASRIGTGLSSAWSWIRSLASETGLGISAAWSWISLAAARLGLSGTIAWQWISRMANLTGTGLLNAWNWIQSVAARMAMMITTAWQLIQTMAGILSVTVTTAWNWIQAVASRISMTILSAWIWVQTIAAMMGMVIIMAWTWIQMAASMIFMTMVRAWNWILAAALRMGMRILAAFTWLISMAARAGKLIVAAYYWLLHIAISVGRSIVAAWNWLLRLVIRFALRIAEFWDWWINAPDIDIETTFAAPDGSGKSRKKIGVGERVTFTGSKTGEWKATGGTPLTQATGTSFVWTAPDRAATIKVSLKSGKYTRDVTLNILEPNAITAKKISEMRFARGRQGVGMKLKFHYHPKTVSFGNADAKEVSGPATNIRGYFLAHGGDYHHDSGDTFFPINHDNVDSATDTAAIWNYPAPWSQGGYDWKIPNHFKVRTEAGDGKKFTEVLQAFTIEGTDGTSTVAKGGEDAERTP